MIKSSKLLEQFKPGEEPSWRDIFLAPILFMLAMTVGQMVSMGITEVLLKVVSPTIGGVYEVYIQYLCGFGLAGLMLFLFVCYTNKKSIRTLGFFKTNAVTKYFKGCGIAVGGLTVIILILVTTGQVTLQVTKSSLGGHIIPLTALIIVTWVVQGAAEEALMRGYMLPALAKRLDVVKGIIVASIIFALLHIGNNGVTVISLLNVLLCGVALALMALQDQSLWAVCGFHTAWNLFQGNVFGIAVSGTQNGTSIFSTTYEAYNFLNGGVFGIEGSILTTLFMLGLIIVFVRKLTDD